MLSFRYRKTLMTGLVAVTWLGALGFFVTRVLPPTREVLSLYHSVRQGDEYLQQWTAPEQTIPSNGLIAAHTDQKYAMMTEADECAWFYLCHNRALDEPVLESWKPDPYEVADNYRRLKRRLADKAGNPNFIEMGPLDDWEKEEGGKPEPEDFAAIEKRACIAKVLVDILGAERSTVIELVDMSKAPITPADCPEAAPAGWDLKQYRVARHRIFPVEVTFSARFGALGRLLDSLVQNPSTVPPGRPCMVVRAIKVTNVEAGPTDAVRVKLGLHVYDFRRLGN